VQELHAGDIVGVAKLTIKTVDSFTAKITQFSDQTGFPRAVYTVALLPNPG